jgi:hypothetical protein
VEGEVSGRGLGDLSWRLAFHTAERFLLEVRSARSRRIAYVEGDRLIVYDPALDQYLQKRVTGRMFDAIRATLGGVDPALEIFLDPSSGLLSFASGFGSLEFREEGGEWLASPAEGYRVRLKEDARSRLVSAVVVEDPEGVVARWTFRVTKGLAKGEPHYRVPEGAVRVESFGEVGEPAVFDDVSRQIVSDSAQKYAGLKTLMYSVRAYAFSGADQTTLQLNGWWEKDGRFRFGVSVNQPALSFGVLYSEGVLAGWDRQNAKLFRSAMPREEVLSKLVAVGVVREPLMRSLLRSEPPWKSLAGPGAKVRYREGDAVFGGEKQHVLDIEQRDGWRVTVYVRAKDLLISRIERSQTVEGKIAFAETILYEYFAVNEPIKPSAWSLGEPPNLKPQGWPPASDEATGRWSGPTRVSPLGTFARTFDQLHGAGV